MLTRKTSRWLFQSLSMKIATEQLKRFRLYSKSICSHLDSLALPHKSICNFLGTNPIGKRYRNPYLPLALTKECRRRKPRHSSLVWCSSANHEGLSSPRPGFKSQYQHSRPSPNGDGKLHRVAPSGTVAPIPGESVVPNHS